MNKEAQSLQESKGWLITGGCGFIGTNLIGKLIERGDHHIRVLDNLSAGTRDDLARICSYTEIPPIEPSFEFGPLSSGVQLIAGDIKDPETCTKACKDVDIVVHLAANTGVAPSVDNPRSDMEANVTGTFNLLEAARHNPVKRFIFASSGAPIGECSPPIHEELAPHPVSPYGASKLAGEGYCSAYFRTFGLEMVVLRFGNVYGPGSTHKGSVVAKFIRKALSGDVCEIYGDGFQTRDFIYIDDLVEAVLKSVCNDVAGETFQIATSREHTVNEVAQQLKAILEGMWIDMRIRHTEPRQGDVLRNFSNTSKAAELLGWQAKVSLEDGLHRTIRWFVNQKQTAGDRSLKPEA